MTEAKPVFIADTCIGGLSVLRSMWASGYANHARFMADYEVNPLGVKSDAAIAEVVDKWLGLAMEHSDTMVIACNTLSIRHHQLADSIPLSSGLKRVVSMVDCLEALISTEPDLLAGKEVLVIGTEFTANQSLYPDMLRARVPGVRVNTVGATELERRIARMIPFDSMDDSAITEDLVKALENTDVAILACTCFPMVRSRLESRFPEVVFMDPGAYCVGLLAEEMFEEQKKLSIIVKGDVVPESRVTEFAVSYLGSNFTMM